jgi:hypothetical protein
VNACRTLPPLSLETNERAEQHGEAEAFEEIETG